jgi:protein-disulfide isomerase
MLSPATVLLRRLFLVALGLFLLHGAGPAAGSTHSFTSEQADAIRQIVRDYLIKNPEVIVEAIEALKAKEQADSESRARQTLATRKGELYDDPSSPVAGNPQGDVAIVEFFDYRCPYCKKVHPGIQTLLREDRNIKFVFKEWPILGPPSVLAARAALAARSQGKYVELHAALMETKGALDEAVSLGAAKSAGLDVDRLKRDMNAQSGSAQAIFAKNTELARSLDITGTPAFVVGDIVLRGAADPETMKKAVADVRRRASR